MKKIITLFFASLIFNCIYAHDAHYSNVDLHHWKFTNNKNVVEGSFYMMKDNNILIEDAHERIFSFPFESLSISDKDYVTKLLQKIATLNHKHPIAAATQQNDIFQKSDIIYAFLILALVGLIIAMVVHSKSNWTRILVPTFSFVFLFSLFGFTGKTIQLLQSSTSIAFLDSAFAPFVPNVHTYHDTTYYYVESKGIPTTHEMMVGISNHGWQQQVPIPQCYLGNNSWSIPLHPTMAASPIPVDNVHFIRGAIALAVNGVPIFNVHTNTGVDSYLDGQLDNYGGHCGRADDYHYHTAPLHLSNYVATNMPIAMGFDGFAVYGSLEPDGSAMQTLDANHGHFGSNGVYHYHGTTAAPYMIANMAGQVTEDNTHQLIPQAAAHPVRPSLTPLNGALITHCTPNSSSNGYNLTYTRNGQTDSVVYSWTTNGQYVFKYYNNGNLDSTKNVNNGFVQCTVPATTTDVTNYFSSESDADIYPNPTKKSFSILLKNEMMQKNLKQISIYNLQGRMIYQTNKFHQNFDVENISNGVYVVKIELLNNIITKKLVIE